MKRFFKKLFATKSKRPAQRTRSFRPNMEALEDRLVPAITDMTALAQQLVTTPDHATHVYLNFDGYHDGQRTVLPYSGNFDQVNDIIFRVSEIYSPFNVEVSRIIGSGNYDAGNGSTTIFIGDDPANTVTKPSATIQRRMPTCLSPWNGTP